MEDETYAGGPPISRAAFLRFLAGAGAALAVPGRGAQAAPSQMLSRKIPATGEDLPAVGLGTWRTFDERLDTESHARLTEVLELLLAGGGRVIDSSPMYGRAEAVVGELLEAMGARPKAFVATKVWTRGKQAGIGQMTQSLAKLRTEQLDLMQVHNLVDWQTHLATLRAWKEEGRIRYLGVTHYTRGALDDLAAIVERERLDFVQLAYSLAMRAAEERVLPLAADRGVAVLVNRPFVEGSLFRAVRGRALPAWAAEFDCASWGQFFLKFILSHPAVTCVIPGTGKPEHMRDNLGAGRGRLPDADLRGKMVALWESV